jgi:putative heme-binding domain-containing protein
VRGKIGVALGPDLGTVQSWMPENILINILDPNHSISHGYDLWNVVLNDGTSMQGIILSETSSAINLNSEGGIKTTIARRDIKSLRTLEVSAMPNDFEKRIDKQQMADLIAFIRQGD